VKERKRPTIAVDRGTADNDEAERLIEPECGGVLFVDVYRQRLPA
jgi:hypothetical protein